MKQAVNKWSNSYFNIFEKTKIIKTYILSLIQYAMYFVEIQPEYLKQINTIIFNFLWNGRDKIKRDTLIKHTSQGGLWIPSISHKQETLIIHRPPSGTFKTFINLYFGPLIFANSV